MNYKKMSSEKRDILRLLEIISFSKRTKLTSSFSSESDVFDTIEIREDTVISTLTSIDDEDLVVEMGIAGKVLFAGEVYNWDKPMKAIVSSTDVKINLRNGSK